VGLTGEVTIVIKGDDQSAQALASALKNVQELGKSGDRSGSLASAGMGRFTTSLQHAHAALTRLDLIELTLAGSQERVTQTQVAYNRAVEQFGPASREAISAHRELEAATLANDRTLLRARMSYVVVAADIGAIATKIPATVGQLVALGTAARGAAAGMGLLSLASAGVLGLTAAAVGVVAFNEHVKFQKKLAEDAALSLGGMIQRHEELRAAMEKAQNTPGWKTGFGAWGEDPFKIQSEMDALSKDMEEKRAVIIAAFGEIQKSVADFRNQQGIQHLIDSGDVANLKVARDEQVRAIADMEAAIKRLDDAKGMTGIEDVVDEAAKAAEELPKATAQLNMLDDAMRKAAAQGAAQFRQAIQDAGVQTSLLSDELLGSLDPALLAVRQKEDALTAAAVQANPALAAQLSTTRRKGETNEELAKRLGLTVEQERQLEAEGRFTTEGLISQAEAQRNLTKETKEFQDLAGPIAQPYGSSSTVTRTGGTTGGPGGGGPINYRALDEELQYALQRSPGAMGHAEVTQYFRWLQAIVGGGNPGNPGTTYALRSKAFKFLAAAKGYNGPVTEPTLFLAGESGPEDVAISPRGGGQAAGSRTEVHQTLNFYGPTDARQVERVTRRQLSIAERRLAAKNT